MALKIGISQRIMETTSYKDTRDALSHDWGNFLEKLEFIPILIPNSLTNVKKYLKNLKLDGIILSGGDNIGDFPIRDKTEKEIIEYGIENKLPILGVCRGMQILNNYFGGGIEKSDSDKHVGKDHTTYFSGKFNQEFGDEIKVNSFHRNIIPIEKLGSNMVEFARCIDDNTCEAISHKELPIIGVMWHPERKKDEFNGKLLKKLFLQKKFW